MDLLVLPSETQPNWEEQFGRVIPEALACGAAVVGSDSGEIPFLVRQSEGGLVFSQRKPARLAEALRKLITDEPLRRKLAAQGRRWVEREIALPAVARRMIGAFEGASMSPRLQTNAGRGFATASHALAQS
jgi:glycosyltransferase involved in cell wall biosynthesis